MVNSDRWLLMSHHGVMFSSIFPMQSVSILFFRSSHIRCLVKKGVLKDFANFEGKHLCWSLFLIKLQAWKDFSKNLFWRTFRNVCLFVLNSFIGNEVYALKVAHILETFRVNIVQWLLLDLTNFKDKWSHECKSSKACKIPKSSKACPPAPQCCRPCRCLTEFSIRLCIIRWMKNLESSLKLKKNMWQNQLLFISVQKEQKWVLVINLRNDLQELNDTVLVC